MKGKHSSASAWLDDLITFLAGCWRRPDGRWMCMCAHTRARLCVPSVSIEADSGSWHLEGHLTFTLTVCGISATPFMLNYRLVTWALPYWSHFSQTFLFYKFTFKPQKYQMFTAIFPITNRTFVCFCADFSRTLTECFVGKRLNQLPVNVSVQGLTPANRFEVPKSEIFSTPL